MKILLIAALLLSGCTCSRVVYVPSPPIAPIPDSIVPADFNYRAWVMWDSCRGVPYNPLADYTARSYPLGMPRPEKCP